jgi:hypothetical protein
MFELRINMHPTGPAISERLAALKLAWGPGNLFRCNQNIRPRA